MPNPPRKVRKDIHDPDETFWTIPDAAAHFGIREATVRRYIREGLPSFQTSRGLVVPRDRYLKKWRENQDRNRATRAQPHTSAHVSDELEYFQ